MKKLKLEIEMENDAMVSASDVGEALYGVRNALVLHPSHINGSIFDKNGNRVGSWKIRNFKPRRG